MTRQHTGQGVQGFLWGVRVFWGHLQRRCVMIFFIFFIYFFIFYKYIKRVLAKGKKLSIKKKNPA